MSECDAGSLEYLGLLEDGTKVFTDPRVRQGEVFIVPTPPKRPPNPERPMWAINPGRTRRNAFGPSRRVK